MKTSIDMANSTVLSRKGFVKLGISLVLFSLGLPREACVVHTNNKIAMSAIKLQ